jgi:uncharacterized protein (TIGR03118 family)
LNLRTFVARYFRNKMKTCFLKSLVRNRVWLAKPQGALNSLEAQSWLSAFLMIDIIIASQSAVGQNAYLQRNLVSDLPGVAANIDTNLLNPWGIAFNSNGPFWISDNHSGLSTLYDGAGVPQSLLVNIPSPAGFTPLGAPTGIIFNSTTNFNVGSNAPAHFIFATEDGTIIGWNTGSNAVLKVDKSASGAVYKGLAIAASGSATYLYATDFHNGKVDVFDSDFNLVTLAGSFVDPSIPTGYAPFGIQNINGQLYVTYAMQDADKHDDVGGPGHGYVDVFTTSGQLVHQLVATGVLNSPWGMALAPVGFGPFGGALLIGNFGDGAINAFDATSGSLLGALDGTNGAPIQITGLWGIVFGNGGKGGDSHTLYFTAGIPGPGVVEDHGLFGSLSPVFPALTVGTSYVQHNLVSDIAGMADHTDTNLLNPWGISFSSGSPFWISDNHSGLSTLYNSSGTPQSLVVTIPTPTNGTPPASPTGTIFNNTSGFAVNTNGPTRFIFATEDGTISGWNGGTAAVLKVDKSAAGTVYKGLTAGSVGTNNYLYATDFHGGKVDVFDSTYGAVTLAGSFTDSTIPVGFAPFGIQNIGGQIYVTYAMQDVNKHDDVRGPGNGYVNVFDSSGHMLRRLASQGVLNSPWGVALAPKGFGGFAGALLVGNFGDGRINAFDQAAGAWLGTVNDTNGTPFSVNGLWGIAFGNGGNGGDTHTLYFTAGLNAEADGLFGSLTPVRPTFTGFANAELIQNLNWAGGVGPFLLQKEANLADSNWVDVLTTGNRSTPIAKDSSAGLLRLAAETTKTVLPFTVLLTGTNEVPETSSTGTAIGTLALEGSNLTYNITFSGLSAPATGAHIHAPASATVSTNVAVPFNVPSATSGTISGTAGLTPELVADIVNGLAYVNIHTTNNPGGEIRGQIVPLHVPVTLNGVSEVPPVQTTASAAASLTLVGNELFYSVTFSGLSGPATGAHIHGPADSTQNTNVIIPFNPPAAGSGSFSGNVTLSQTELEWLLAGQTYINIHTATNGGGEIRGQIYPLQFNAILSGAGEVPPTTSVGTGAFSSGLANSVLTYTLSFTNLFSAATGAHIHGPATTLQNTNVIVPFNPPSATFGTFSGSANLDTQVLLDLVSGLTYVNVHTTNFPGGEIRGQVVPNN